MELSVIIINHNTPSLTCDAVRSVVSTTLRTLTEIIIVDNSSDESLCFDDSSFQCVKSVRSGNYGFGTACNLGVKHSSGEYLLFLNSDTIVHPECIDNAVKAMRTDEKIGILGAKILRTDGSLDHGCKRGFPTPAASLYYFLGFDRFCPENRKYGAYRQTFIPEDTFAEIDAVSGAFLMISRKNFDALGGFDTDFFMYGEDLDLCYRAKKSGLRVFYFPQSSITHLRGQSGLSKKNKKSKDTIRSFHNAMEIFYRKHYVDRYNPLVNLLVLTAIKIRFLIQSLVNRI